MPSKPTTFIVELTTRQGRVSERYPTYAEARRRVDQFPADSLVGPALIFQELPDGSERLVREDGKPLQVHRRLVEEAKNCSEDDPLPLTEDTEGRFGSGGELRFVELRRSEDGWEELPPE
ncbi:MAG TPA: hypothetical protein VNK04_24115 [Gemmataceae bacterium]|nr:hypothetical protein [Gemmataceae bacterium]